MHNAIANSRLWVWYTTFQQYNYAKYNCITLSVLPIQESNRVHAKKNRNI